MAIGQSTLEGFRVSGLGGTLSTFPNFLAYFAVGAVLIALFVVLYSNLTPQ